MQVHLLETFPPLGKFRTILYLRLQYSLLSGEGVLSLRLKQVQRERKTYKSAKARKTLAIQQDVYKYTIWGQGKVTSSVI